jgi:hypothetical protein
MKCGLTGIGYRHWSAELRIDIDNVVSLLPAESAAIAILLKSLCVVEVARRLACLD